MTFDLRYILFENLLQHSIWYVTWHSVCHFIWLVFFCFLTFVLSDILVDTLPGNAIWHSYLTYILTFYLELYLTLPGILSGILRDIFSLAFYLTCYAFHFCWRISFVLFSDIVTDSLPDMRRWIICRAILWSKAMRDFFHPPYLTFHLEFSLAFLSSFRCDHLAPKNGPCPQSWPFVVLFHNYCHDLLNFHKLGKFAHVHQVYLC